MNLLQPERLADLAREHALGSLQGGARRRFERLLRESEVARIELGRWQEQLASLTTDVPPMHPRPQVWQRLNHRLGLVPAPEPRQPAWWSARLLGSVVASAMAGVLLSTVLLQANPAWLGHEALHDELPASYVGLLSDAAGRPTVLLSSRRQGRVLSAKLLQPLVERPSQTGAVGHLWAFPQDGGAPFLVGTLPSKGSAKLPLSDHAEKLFFPVDRLGVSFEPAGSSPTLPTGPLVLAGPCVKLW